MSTFSRANTYIIRATFFVSLMILLCVGSVTHAASGFNPKDSYAGRAVYAVGNEVYYVQDGTTPKKIQITSATAISGIGAFEQFAIIATQGGSDAIYKYWYGTGVLEQVGSFSDMGPLEDAEPPDFVQIFNENWIYYNLQPTAYDEQGNNVGTRGTYQKLYNLKTKQGYGTNEVINRNFSGSSSADIEAQQAEADKKEFAFQRLSVDEKINVGNIYAFDPAPVSGQNVFMVAHGGYGEKNTHYTEYRLLDLATMKVKKTGYQSNIDDTIHVFPAKNVDTYALGSRVLPGTEYEVFYRVNIFDPTSTKEIFRKKLNGTTLVLAYDGDAIVWDDGTTVSLYEAKSDITCRMPSSKIVHKEFGRISQGYFFNLEGVTPHFVNVSCDQTKKDVPVQTTTSPIVTPIISPVDLTDGSLIKSTTLPAVYYQAKDGKRYVFSDREVFGSWYKDFSSMKTITPEAMANITIGGNVTYRPGTRMVKISSDPRVYAVDAHGTLRWIANETVARGLYGASWAKEIRVIPDFLFINYTVGAPISTVSDFSPGAAIRAATSINVDKSL